MRIFKREVHRLPADAAHRLRGIDALFVALKGQPVGSIVIRPVPFRRCHSPPCMFFNDPPGSAGPQALLSNMVDPCPACRAVLAIRRPRLFRLGRGMIMPPASAEGVGAVRGSCSHVLLLAERLSACGQLAVAVRLIGPASQPAGGAHIRDGACALGPCPWEVPMQSPKPKAARRFPVPYGF